MNKFCYLNTTLCWLKGAEDHGIPEKYLEKCQEVIKIPFGAMSLNVSVTGSIILYDRLAKHKWADNPQPEGLKLNMPPL